MATADGSKTVAFFDLPLDDRMALHMRNTGPALRGYLEVCGENTDPGTTRDFKECIDLGPERDGPARPFSGGPRH